MRSILPFKRFIGLQKGLYLKCLSGSFNLLGCFNFQIILRNYHATENEYKDELIRNIKMEMEAIDDRESRPPFVKNLFCGRFDRDILSYPEAIDQERHSVVEQTIPRIRQFFQTEVNDKINDQASTISNEVITGLKGLNIFGLRVPAVFQGGGWNWTEYCRVSEEMSINASVGELLTSHHDIVSQILVDHGSDIQRNEYLPKLASGELLSTYCLTEEEAGNDFGSLDLTARITETRDGYRLNGTKIRVPNGCNSDLLVVFAVVKHEDGSGKTRFPSVFLVNRNSEGVLFVEDKNEVGPNRLLSSTIRFKDTFVPAENLIGQVGEASNVVATLQQSQRLSYGARLTGVMKRLVDEMTRYVSSKRCYENALSEYSLIRQHVALLETDAYAIEAMTYLMAGLKDNFKDHDCHLEAAIVKSYAVEKSYNHVCNFLKIMGTDAYGGESNLERLLQEIRSYQLFESSVDMPKFFIALSGLQFSGVEKKSLVKRLRNPFMFPHESLKYNIINALSNPLKLDLRLHEYLHPRLKWAADVLETCMKKFDVTVTGLLGRDGKNVSLMSNQVNLVRIADMAIDLFALTAVLGRASRSYCIGIHNAEHEMRLANIFTWQVERRFSFLYENAAPNFNENDKIVAKVADDIFSKRGYAAQHPTSRIYW